MKTSRTARKLYMSVVAINWRTLKYSFVSSILSCLIIFAAVFTPAAAKAEPINIEIYVDAKYSPFSFEENGTAKGLYNNVLRAAFNRMKNFNVTLTPVPWNRGKRLMKQGKGIGLAPAFFHGHDWPYLHPYSLPFYVETIILICREDFFKPSQRLNWPDDFKGMRIGNVLGFDGWGGDAFRQLVKNKEVDYIEAQSSEALIMTGMRGPLDCFLMEEAAFDTIYHSLVKKFEADGSPYKHLKKGPVTGRDPVYIGYSRPARIAGTFPSMYEFMQAFDSAIYAMQKSGDIERIMSQTKD